MSLLSPKSFLDINDSAIKIEKAIGKNKMLCGGWGSL